MSNSFMSNFTAAANEWETSPNSYLIGAIGEMGDGNKDGKGERESNGNNGGGGGGGRGGKMSEGVRREGETDGQRAK